MDCSWYRWLVTTNTASLNTVKPKHGHLIRILLCRCRYKQEMNHDSPKNMWCSSPPEAASGWSHSIILTYTLLPLCIGRIYTQSGGEEHPACVFRISSHSWAHCCCNRTENTFFLKILLVFILFYLYIQEDPIEIQDLFFHGVLVKTAV